MFFCELKGQVVVTECFFVLSVVEFVFFSECCNNLRFSELLNVAKSEFRFFRFCNW